MHQLHPRLALFLFAIVIIAGHAAAQEPFALMRSLFDPGTNAQTTARQGSSVATDGNRVVIGVPFDQAGGSGAGSVKVYDATTGLLLYTLLNPYPSLGEFFGRSVAISGNRVVIGADWDKGGTNVAGSAVGGAYVYELAGPTPTVPVMALTNPSPASTGVADFFGFSVAISGNRVVIGAPGEDIDGIDTGIAYVYDLAGVTPLVPQFVLRNPTPATNEGFGYAVAISSARVVVSAPFDGVGATYAGSTYVFDLNGATPTAPITTLNNPDPGVSDQFGFSVAISGSRVVVGANQNDIGATDAGNAYVYDLTSATPHIPVLTLGSSAPVTGDNFGYAVAISGGRVLIGAIYDDRSGVTNAGHAYVFDLASPTPTFPVVFLYNPSPAVGDNFGYAVAISGDRLVVGAPYDDTGATDAGSGYLYDLSGATPAIPTATLAHPSPAATDRFGYAVAVSGTRMVVGAIRDDTGATDAGRVYVYDLAGANPNAPMLTLNNPAPQNNDLFGWSVGISGTHIVVGVPGKDFQTNNSGFVYVYNLADGTPTIPIFGVTNPTPAASDQFGIAVAIDGTRLVVGTPFDDTGATNAGSAYVYQLTGIGPRVPIATLTNPIPAVNDRFGAAVAISGSRVVIGAYQDDTGWPDAGSAYIYDVNSANARVPVHTLNKPSTSYNDTAHFGYSVAIAATRVVVGAYRDRFGGGNVYVYDLASASPTVPVATLSDPGSNDFNDFGWAVATSGPLVLVGSPQSDVGASGAGIAYLYDMTSATPTIPVATLPNPRPGVGNSFGWAVAMENDTILAAAYNDDTNAEDRGAVYIFAPRPRLTVVPAMPGLASISWMTSNISAFVLQYTDRLAPANWISAPSGAANPVTISTTNAARFYRLVQP